MNLAFHVVRITAVCLPALLLFSGCLGTTGGGIHARLAWSEQRGLRVVEVPAGPARDAGLQAGDQVVSIDGEDIAPLTLREAVELLRGPTNSEVRLEVSRDGVQREITIAREPYR